MSIKLTLLTALSHVASATNRVAPAANRVATAANWVATASNWALPAIIIGAITFASCTSAQANIDTPLTQNEHQLADAIARASMTSVDSKRSVIPEALSSGTTETLLITLKEIKSSTVSQSFNESANESVNKAGTRSRLAEVFFYDYSTQLTEYRVIDLFRKTIVRSQSLNQHHLPLNQNEQELARQILQANAVAMQQIRMELGNTASMPLSETNTELLSNLDIKVTVHEPHGSLGGPTSICSVQRCAELSLVTKNLLSLTLEPVISLFNGQIISMKIY